MRLNSAREINCCTIKREFNVFLVQSRSRYRLALNSYPRSGDGTTQLKRWMYTRIYVNLLARAEAREKLINIVVAVFTLILCRSLISYFLTCLGASLIQYNHIALEPSDGIWKHIHFYLVTLASIGSNLWRSQLPSSGSYSFALFPAAHPRGHRPKKSSPLIYLTITCGTSGTRSPNSLLKSLTFKVTQTSADGHFSVFPI